MSFLKIDDTSNLVSDHIKYTYSGVSVNKSDIHKHTNDDKHNSIKKSNLAETSGKRIPEKNIFYKINYINREANFIYDGINPSDYIANNIYLYGLLHNNISGITSNTNDIIGEIVIQHSNANKQSQKVYSCFLVGQHPNKMMNNSVDTVVNMITNKGDSTEFTLSLTTEIPEQTRCFYYTDEGNHIFVYTAPILVNEHAATFLKNELSTKTKLFDINPSCDPKLIKLSEGFSPMNIQEGLDNEVYIDCQPHGESPERINAYAVPIDSEFSDSKNQIDMFKQMLNFCIFLMVAFVAQFTIPTLYKKLVIDKINTNETPNPNDRRKEILHTDLLISCFCFIYILSSFIIGMGSNGIGSILYFGIGLLIFYVLSFSLIHVKKAEPDYMKTPDPNSSTDNPLGDIDSSYPVPPNKPYRFTGMEFITQIGFFGTLLSRISNLKLFSGILFSVLAFFYLIIWLVFSSKNNKLSNKEKSFSKDVTEDTKREDLPGYTEHREEYDKFNNIYNTISGYTYSLGAILVTPILYLSLR
jgi:hypothetical protein